ncbi:MAG: DUF3276 family protein [Bacteroidota bacterium]
MAGKLFSSSFYTYSGTYFIDVKEASSGDVYLVITESRFQQDYKYKRESVRIFEESINEFVRNLNLALKTIDKTLRIESIITDFKLDTHDEVTIDGGENTSDVQFEDYSEIKRRSPILRYVKKDRFKQIRKTYPNAYEPWTKKQDAVIEAFVEAGKSVEELAYRLGRTYGSVKSRIKKLNL